MRLKILKKFIGLPASLNSNFTDFYTKVKLHQIAKKDDINDVTIRQKQKFQPCYTFL